MTRPVSLFEFMPYGAPELLASARANMARALAVGSSAFIVAFALLAGLLHVIGTRPPLVVELPDKHIDLFPEPQTRRPLPPVAPLVQPSKPDAGEVVPVPDEEIIIVSALPEPETTRAGTEGSGAVSATPQSPGAGAQAGGVALPGPRDFVYVEELPVPITRVDPDYPDLARSAGVDGLVEVRALVGTDGRVIRAIVFPERSIPMLNAAATAAAEQWIFKPALSNGRAVAVWVSVPFRFRLH